MEPSTDFLYNKIRSYFIESARVKRRLAGSARGFDYSQVQAVTAGLSLPSYVEEKEASSDVIETIVRAASAIHRAFQSGGKLLLCGNGGSAADCQHVAAEFTNILDRSFDRGPLPAIALTTDTSFLTSFVNDSRRFAEIFSRQVEALGRRGDVLLGLSTSGNSENVIRAVETARRMGIATVALTGQGGKLGSVADITIAVPSKNTSHIQEAHLAVEHAICDAVEHLMFPEKGSSTSGAV